MKRPGAGLSHDSSSLWHPRWTGPLAAARGNHGKRRSGMSGRMSGRVVVVTGASSGIGLATAKLLAAEGAAVGLAALPDSGLQEAQADCENRGAQAISVPCNVAESSSVSAVFETAMAKFGRVDAVFNNAGMSMGGALIELTDDQWQRV